MLGGFSAHAAHGLSFDFTPAAEIRQVNRPRFDGDSGSGRIENDRTGIVSDVVFRDASIASRSGNLINIDAQFSCHPSHVRRGGHQFSRWFGLLFWKADNFRLSSWR